MALREIRRRLSYLGSRCAPRRRITPDGRRRIQSNQSSGDDMSATDTAIVNTKANDSAIAALVARAAAITVKDQETYIDAAAIKRDAQSYLKNVGFELDPGIAKAKDTLDHLKDQKQKWVGPAKEIVDSITTRMQNYAAEEKRKAQVEED